MEKPSRAIPILGGVVIAVATFVAILAGVAWFMPRFLRFADSPWAHLFEAVAISFACFFPVVAHMRYRRKRRT